MDTRSQGPEGILFGRLSFGLNFLIQKWTQKHFNWVKRSFFSGILQLFFFWKWTLFLPHFLHFLTNLIHFFLWFSNIPADFPLTPPLFLCFHGWRRGSFVIWAAVVGSRGYLRGVSWVFVFFGGVKYISRVAFITTRIAYLKYLKCVSSKCFWRYNVSINLSGNWARLSFVSSYLIFSPDIVQMGQKMTQLHNARRPRL